MKRLVLFLVAVCLSCPVSALEVSSIFADGMVLQQGMQVPVWGWGEPGEAVTVEFAKKKKLAVASGSGKWQVQLDPMSASSKPRKMSIDSSIGNQKLEIDNILVGEVWLCSGQSNMGMGMAGVDNAKQEMAAANFSGIRAFDVAHIPAENPREQVQGRWLPCQPDKMPLYSATAYYFARRIHQETGVPVGIVVVAWGGSSVASWMSREALMADPACLSLPQDSIGWQINHRQSRLFNGMIHPLIPYAMTGVIWHQGESDSDSGVNPYRYRVALPQMIQDWRAKWSQPDLSFYLVQLQNLSRPNDDWAVTRESQQAALVLPATGMITTIDIGNHRKLHPPNKKDFGERLANLVLQKKYGFKIDAESPAYVKSVTETGAVRITFSKKLKTTNGLAPGAFRIAGEDRKFADAQARIEGSDVIVSSLQVSSPVVVRYAWADDSPVNLCGENGLPATPFRTDDWTVSGEDMVWKELPQKSVPATRYSTLDIANGKSPDWVWRGTPRNLTADQRKSCLRQHPAGLFLTVKPLWMRRPEADRPVFRWETAKSSPMAGFDPQKGCTIDLRAEVSEGTDPFHGLDLELTLPRQDGSIYRYRLSIQPLRVYGFSKEAVHVLGADVRNTADQITYRIAVRPDGGAQVYMDSKPLGMLPGEPVENPGDVVASFSWGKFDRKNRLDAKISSIGMDMSGGFGMAP